MTKSRSSEPKRRDQVSHDQRRRFIETARSLDCDEDRERFEERLGQIAKAKPPVKPKQKDR
jgi:hypothetical protein